MYAYLPETKGRALEDMSQYFAEITGDRSILEAEETLYRRDDQAEFRPPAEPEVQPARKQPKKNVAPEKPPPEDAHVMGTMA